MDPIYRSELNRDVEAAREGEFQPLKLAGISVWPPVVLAPMAGVTNYPFRSICRGFGAGLYVSEMITARALVYGNKKTARLASFGPDESPRSLQLYGSDPHYLGEAARRLIAENGVDHIDLNFGCPVRKVTSKGGGSAIPAKPRLLRRLVHAVVEAAGTVPVTIKVRMGLWDELLTFLSSGEVAEGEGCAAIGLHARTTAQLYSGAARWEAIAALKAHVGIPVLGNGDIWEAEDALRMMRTTGCDGVIVGRGCLGRPWLFRDLADVFNGREPQNPPGLAEVLEVARLHARKLMQWVPEKLAMSWMRKYNSWYTKGFSGGAGLRKRLMGCSTYAEMDAIFSGLDGSEAFPPAAVRARRCKSGQRQRVVLPDGYLEQLQQDDLPVATGETVPGGG